MSDIVISVEHLSKLYTIQHRKGDDGLRHAIHDLATAPLRWLQRQHGAWSNGHGAAHNANGLAASAPLPLSGSQLHAPSSMLSAQEDFWALKDVSFEVKRGEVVGIIGRNGAGKSTLLKILSRITEPTEGKVRIRGRVASLLEVGTGFHPELTGRENIFVNGAILGMTRAEIQNKFDEIVAFAEVDKFLDTPVKRYSSGMYVRLAFAVAAHLEPEVLLVDEVLAVGDAAFQKKCLGKMGDVARGGRTVLFVSHQINQIRRLCERSIWLDVGRLQKMDSTVQVLSAYEIALRSMATETARDIDHSHVVARFLKWEIVEPCCELPNVLVTMGPVTLRFVLKVNKPIHNGVHGIILLNSDSQIMWGTNTKDIRMDCGMYQAVYRLPALHLRPGAYFWRVSLYDENGELDIWDCIPELTVAAKPVTHLRDEWAGILNVPYQFSIDGYDG